MDYRKSKAKLTINFLDIMLQNKDQLQKKV
jgi:hypothetical protein